jgi:hypothetical protein
LSRRRQLAGFTGLVAESPGTRALTQLAAQRGIKDFGAWRTLLLWSKRRALKFGLVPDHFVSLSQCLSASSRRRRLGSIVEPIDAPRAVVFLASDDVAAITGLSLPSDYGLIAGNIVMTGEFTLREF